MLNADYVKEFAHKMRLRILELAYGVGKNGAHVGGGLSSVEIFSTLYGSILNYNLTNPIDKNRDRLIVSKGHCAIALFTALEQVGYISNEELDQFEVNGSAYYAHASRNLLKGIEFSGGSLSLGLSFAVGVALSNKMEGLNNHVYVLLGDGECDEGLVWESLMSAAHFNLTNLTVIVDCNDLQSDGHKKKIMNQLSLADKFTSFGFSTNEVNGHNIEDLYNSFNSKSSTKPNAIIARTVKGKGVSFMENNKDWHHGVLSLSQYELAVSEQI
ncbi:MAG: 1-deoxy-D-xylulose-5-phosphate synthase N-terminal domain-containing protein [Paludibacter sp.]